MRFTGLLLGGVILAGCNGSSFIGSGDDAGVGGSGGSGGSGATGSGGAAAGGSGGVGAGGMGATGGDASGGSGGGSPCAGKPCGASCSTCEPDKPCATIDTWCDAAGNCEPSFPVCEVPQCETIGDCPAIGAACTVCADGSSVCPTTECIDGQCRTDYPVCETECTTDVECPISGAPCQLCSDGTTACPVSGCIEGKCQHAFESCDDYDPCAGKLCGETCHPCDPADPNCVAPAVTHYCDANGTCNWQQPECRPCETGLCARPYECVTACGQEPEYVGCCPCEPPLFDAFVECPRAQ